MTPDIVHVTAGQAGRSWWGPGDMYTFLVTGEESDGAMFALDCVVGAGGGPPPHRHLAEDELFTITEGTVVFTAGEETRLVSVGESVFVPRGTLTETRARTPRGCSPSIRQPGWRAGSARFARRSTIRRPHRRP